MGLQTHGLQASPAPPRADCRGCSLRRPLGDPGGTPGITEQSVHMGGGSHAFACCYATHIPHTSSCRAHVGCCGFCARQGASPCGAIGACHAAKATTHAPTTLTTCEKKTTPRTHPTSPPVLLIPLIYLNGAALSMLSVPGLSARRKCPPLRASPATIQTQIPLGTHPMLPPKVPAVLV